MIKKITLIFLLAVPCHLLCQVQDTSAAALNREEQTPLPKKQKKGKKNIKFSYTNEEIVNVINFLAAERGVNIMLPHGANAITGKLTLNIEEKLTLDEAWNKLVTILDVAGYSIFPRNDMYMVVKNGQNTSKEPLPIYIGLAPHDIPDSDGKIRYLYYLSNIKVPEQGAEGNELSAVLKEILPDSSVYRFDPLTNGMLIIDKADNIRAAMRVILELDKVGFKETLDIFRLRYTSATLIADLFNKNILKSSTDERFSFGPRRASESSFFSKAAKLIPDERTNSLIVLGKPQAIDRIKEFIYQYIDVELESGKSILHTVQLQYLDAASFAEVLTRIVQGNRPAGTEQSRLIGASGGPERYFDGVIIKADKPGEGGGTGKYFGGNKLIVAARNEDWVRIKELIEKLDTPQSTVIIEVLIADLTIEDSMGLGAQLRNPMDIPLPQGMNFQSAQLNRIISPDGANGLATDLLKKDFVNGTQSLAALSDPGTTILSINDTRGTGIWAVLEVLKTYNNTKILSNPHIIAINNQQASVKIGETRLVAGAASGSAGGSTTAANEEIPAELNVFITPRISSSETVNLQVDIKVNEFTTSSANNATRTERRIITNANIKNGGVLALGGLIKDSTNHSTNETPLLGKIPILGWLFKRRVTTKEKNNLTVFISPTIVQPRLRGGVSDYTRDYLKVAKKYVNEGMLFDTLRDPVTHWFFKTSSDAGQVLDAFLAKDQSDAARDRAFSAELDSVDEPTDYEKVTGERTKTLFDLNKDTVKTATKEKSTRKARKTVKVDRQQTTHLAATKELKKEEPAQPKSASIEQQQTVIAQAQTKNTQKNKFGKLAELIDENDNPFAKSSLNKLLNV